MSAELVARIRKNRELKVKVGEFTFTARRPTDVEVRELAVNQTTDAEIAQTYVTDWGTVTENDIVGGGGSEPVKFNPTLWREWCADTPKFWEPISGAVLQAWREHSELAKEAEKN